MTMGYNLSILLLISTFLASNGLSASETKHAGISKFKSVDQLSYKHRISANGIIKRTHMESAKISGRSDIVKQEKAPGRMFISIVFKIDFTCPFLCREFKPCCGHRL